MAGKQSTAAAAVTNIAEDFECGSFFDHIDDFLDFPSDDFDTLLPLPPPNNDNNSFLNDSSFDDIWPTHESQDSIFSHNHSNNSSASDLSAELSVPYEDIVQLEWLSSFVEDSFSGGNLMANKSQDSFSGNKDASILSNSFQTPSPVSVLESSSSCSGSEKSAGPHSPSEIVAPSKSCGRARSKRPRPATFTPRPTIAMPTNSENSAESRFVIKIPKHVIGFGGGENKMKKKKLKPTAPVPVVEADQNAPQQQNVRKCLHCEVTKTPQWRSGPMGPKTLCNACGVRHKSGRLFPEYRPAASPTFVPCIHSNSHKKVLEMRTRAPDNFVMNNLPELIPNNNNHLAMEYM